MTEQVQDAQPDILLKILSGGMSPTEEKAAIEQCVRAKPALTMPVLHAVLAQKQRCRLQLEEIQKTLMEPPWHSAAFLWLSSGGTRAVVASAGRRLSVTVAPQVDRAALECGQPVFLNATQNVLIDVAPGEPRPGAVGEFSRLHGTRQGVIRSQAEEEIVVDLAAGIVEDGITKGDLVLYDREGFVAYEKLEKRNRSALLEDLPLDVRIEDLGGLDAVFDELVSDVTLHLFHSDLVRRYALKPTKGVLLCGPPGTGKTSLVQALGERLGRTMGVEIKAFVVRPGVHRSMWFGASEQRVRDLFREAGAAAEERDRYVLLFFDDMDHLGSRDHRLAGEVDARLLPCFLQEIDALRTDRLLLVGATNREDLLDEALLRPGRFGRTFRIARPSRRQAREIFRRYLTCDLPVRRNGDGPVETVQGLIEDVLAALYAPNGEFSTLAMLTFRDGSRQPLGAAHILSGALIASAVEQCKRRGCFRALKGGPGEVGAEDLRAAMARELTAICERLKPGLALQQMLDLPPDRDVVKVERCRPDEQPRPAFTSM
jgi:proteasome-associated ATPase